MTFYYSDLGSDFGWHFPDLGSDTSLARNFCARSLEVLSVDDVSKCRLFCQARHRHSSTDNKESLMSTLDD